MLTLVTNIVTIGPPGFNGYTNLSQYWDFSQPQQPYECVLRTDIIPPENGTNNEQFPDAVYAEQDTLDGTNFLGCRYYGWDDDDTNSGRVFYGMDVPTDQSITPWAAFNPPVVDIPSSVQYGQTWSGSLYWFANCTILVPLSNYYSFTATADAYGTLVLPQLGEVPALRIHEVESYAISDVWPPIPLAIMTNQYLLLAGSWSWSRGAGGSPREQRPLFHHPPLHEYGPANVLYQLRHESSRFY